MKIVIFDVNDSGRKQLAETLSAWRDSRGLKDVSIRPFKSLDALRFSLPDLSGTAAYFLDITAPEIGDAGFHMAEMIHSRDPLAKILLIADNSKYVEEAFEISVFRYYFPPISRERLFKVLDELYGTAEGNLSSFIFHGFGQEWVLDPDQILHIQAFTSAHMAKVFLLSGSIIEISLSKYSFSELARRLVPAGFFRCHRSHLIHLKYVSSYRTKKIVLQDGTAVPVSRNINKDLLRSVLEEHEERASLGRT